MGYRETEEIGGYIGLDRYDLPILHENAVALNCGRNCLRYLINAKKIRKILLPYFLCESIREACIKEGVEIRYYHIDEGFKPSGLTPDQDEWIYLVNYYGQLTAKEIGGYRDRYGKVIIDNAQAYFEMPVQGTDTLYTCRKFFGVPDGAFLYTDDPKLIGEGLEQDESHGRMAFILGRYERPASEFYDMYTRNNEAFSWEPVKRMSRLTRNLLHGIDHPKVKEKRTQNYSYLYERLRDMNKLKLKKIEGAFAYPLFIENGPQIREKMIEQKIYIPTLWPNVLSDMGPESLEYRFAKDILPLPCDQRYGYGDMEKICEVLNYLSDHYRGGLKCPD